jgi:hypothetical protein
MGMPQPSLCNRARDMIYNVPLRLIDAYPQAGLIVRTDEPVALVQRLPHPEPARLVCVQLCRLPRAIEPLINWGEGIPVDILLRKPADFPQLYRYSKLLDNHPVRVTMPAVAGVSKAVTLASALQFAVKLDITSPTVRTLEELQQVADYALHHTTVSQPVDWFYSLLLAYFHNATTTLWDIQEENPDAYRYITEQGEERLNGRGALDGRQGDLKHFSSHFQQTLSAQGAECRSCPYVDSCGGYFKWPDPHYRCDGIKALLHTIRQAAEELRRDLTTLDVVPGEQTS